MTRRVCMFGALRLEQDERPLALGGKIASLFAYILLHPQPHPRERLANLLAPDASPERAAHNFSALLYRLRQTLGSDWLEADEERVALRVTPDLWVDAWEFERLAASDDLEDQRRAVAIYRDDLLPEIYDDWILPRRVALREEFLHCLAMLGEQAERAHDQARAFEYFHRFAFADPLNEDPQRGLMRVYARMGRHAAALQQYAKLTQALADELGVEPQPETRALAESIRAERAESGAQVAAEKPFIGRKRERAHLLELTERAQNGRGGIVLVEGEAGIGKTRLLENLAEGAAWRGLSVVWGRARELTGLTPFMPLDQALRAACAGPRAEQLQARLAPPFVETLAGLEPRLRAKSPTHIANLPSLEDALAQGLCALADIAPHLFLLDDVQWADASFWDAILKLAPLIETRRLLVVLGYRGDDLRADDAAWRALRGLDRESAPPRLALAGLNEAECAELAGALGQALDQTSVRALRQRTNGNPLFAAQILSEGGESDHASYKELFARRLARLDRAARASLEAGAVLGREFTHGAWQSLAGEAVLETIPALIAEGLIHESESGYLFDHDLARETIYKDIETGRLRDLHRRAGEILAQERAEPGALAFHFEQGEIWEAAVRYYREAGERAANAYAYDTALEYYESARRLLGRLEDPRAESMAYLLLLVRQHRIYRVWVQTREWRENVEQLEKAALEANDNEALIEALQARVSLHLLDSNWDGMQEAAERAIALAQREDHPAAEARVRAELGWHLADMLGRARDSLPHLERAVTLAERLDDKQLLMDTLGHLAFSQRILGRAEEARSTVTRIFELADSHDEFRLEKASALETLGQIEMDLAHWQSASATMSEFTQQVTELKEHWLTGQGFFNQSMIAARSGRYKDAQDILGSLKFLLTAAGLGAPADHWMWSEALNAESLVLAGDLDQAELVLEGMRSWMASKSNGRPLLLALTALGRLRLAQNRPAEAKAILARATGLWKQAGGNIEVAPLLLHALAAHRAGDDVSARTSLREAEDTLRGTPVATHAVLLHFVRHELSGDPSHLRAARAEIQRQAALFTDEKLRADFLNNVALHREIEARWRTLHPTPQRVTVRLACADAPLGRALTDADFVSIAWTVDAGEEDADILRREGKVALRRHRLNRLIREAREQNAAPTDADLARALGVNTRTIERDAACLRAAGQKTKTRKRG